MSPEGFFNAFPAQLTALIVGCSSVRFSKLSLMIEE
jgi:hypothetical protein